VSSRACWPPRKQQRGGANRSFTTLDDREVAQTDRCLVLQNEPEVICFLIPLMGGLLLMQNSGNPQDSLLLLAVSIPQLLVGSI
jgi:hypothetical protein